MNELVDLFKDPISIKSLHYTPTIVIASIFMINNHLHFILNMPQRLSSQHTFELYLLSLERKMNALY
jgi:hypothetical protein